MMKRLVFCFDGTWNRLDSKTPTNVVLTAECVIPVAHDGTPQLIFYDQGVGTDKWDIITGGTMGAGLVDNIADGYRFLIFNYTPGDEIYVFGFSRGAYTARSFVGLLRNCGILRRRDAGRVTEAIKRYQSRKPEDHPTAEEMNQFRSEFSPDVCVGQFEDDWRCAHVPGYTVGSSPKLSVRYLGVWDTVGSLGIPARYRPFDPGNKRYGFHDIELTEFVDFARHALAIDERRVDFDASPWLKFEELNRSKGFDPDRDDAPYQQKWFPGVHGSVGGGGERRGLSDQALDWILDGARHAGLKLDASPTSRIYELEPDHREFLRNMAPRPHPSPISWAMDKLLPTRDRAGPKALYEVSISARRRWLDDPANLKDGQSYRPATLNAVATALAALGPQDVGLGIPVPPPGTFELHEVVPGDTLGGLALHYYGSAALWTRIMDANRDKITDRDRIYVGQILKIPSDGIIHRAAGDPR